MPGKDLHIRVQLGANGLTVNKMAPDITGLAIGGAGTKGPAEAAAYKGLSEGWHGFVNKLRYVFGTSAGSMIAALISSGCSPEKIIERVKNVKFKELLDLSSQPTNGRLKKIYRGCANLFTTGGIYKGEKILEYAREALQEEIKTNLLTHLKNVSVYQAVKEIGHLKKIGLIKNVNYKINKKGKITAIEDIELTNTITFNHINELAILHPDTFKKLYITGTNYSKNRLEVFCKENTPEMEVALAVRISMSIPWVFGMVKYNGDYYMDGGCLNNFPLDLLDDDKFIERPEFKGLHGHNLGALGIKMSTETEKKAEGQKPKHPNSKWSRVKNGVKNRGVGVNYSKACKDTADYIYKRHPRNVMQVSDKGQSFKDFDLNEAKLQKLNHSGLDKSADHIALHQNEVVEIKNFSDNTSEQKSSAKAKCIAGVKQIAIEHPEYLPEIHYQLKKYPINTLVGKAEATTEDEELVNATLRQVNTELNKRNVYNVYRMHPRVKKAHEQVQVNLAEKLQGLPKSNSIKEIKQKEQVTDTANTVTFHRRRN